jgi:23S rRNA pseudouridine2605 synthase
MQDDTTQDKGQMIRISKAICNLGYCSRRKAELLVKNLMVKVNGETVKSIAFLVNKDDKIEVDFKKQKNLDGFNNLGSANTFAKVNKKHILQEHFETEGGENDSKNETKLYAFYKPLGYLVSEAEDNNKPTIYSIIPKSYGRLIYIGRLDINTEGLLLLTNNGELARQMSLPKNEVLRKYIVRAHGFFDEKKIKRMSKGVIIEGLSYKPKYFDLRKGEQYKVGSSSNLRFDIWLDSGKNREIRKYFKHFNLEVNKIVRTDYHTISYEGMRPGDIMQIPDRKVKKMLEHFKIDQ